MVTTVSNKVQLTMERSFNGFMQETGKRLVVVVIGEANLFPTQIKALLMQAKEGIAPLPLVRFK